ncbi:membrane protein [Bacteroidia bacterium]|nr:membrane protein [Bacteroidia bacterium]GHT04651.1 membrane protein [Bacteroidia bacterium]
MNIKKLLPHAGVLAFFFLIVLVYFYPAFEGKVLQQGDITQFKGVAQELLEYDKPSGWTGSMFSGMPSYQITGYSTGINFTAYIHNAVYSDVAGPIFFLLITAYILFLVLGAPWWLAALGAVAMAFSSYNLIIIQAGHITKAWALTYVPLVLAGMSLVFKKKYWPGFILFAFGLALLIVSNHLQITYYAAIFCLILYIGFLVERIVRKEYKRLGVSTGILAAGVLLAVLANLSNLYLNYEAGQESMRGQSELTPTGAVEIETPVSNGLDKDYVFAWSYGKAETLSLLIPNVMGGGSGGSLGKDSHLYKELKAHGAQVGKEVQTYTYWGDKPFTSGPVYFGAIVCFLFLFAFFIVPKNFKWWLLGATVFFILLAWGRNLAGFNDWMYYHFPLYNKFRTVEMALVIPAFTFPILAVLALKELVGAKHFSPSQNNELIRANNDSPLRKSLYWSAGITAGICFLLWIMPGTFLHFESSYDAQFQSQVPDWYYYSLLEDRKDLLKADALRSLIFIALAAGLVFAYIQSKNRKKFLPFMAAGLFILVLFDLWQVDKRYLNEQNFVSNKTYKEQLFPKSVADNIILQDPGVSYRVLNLNNPFQESRTSYYHKSIGGYHAAKLGRYQDLIDRRLTKEIQSFSTATSIDDLKNRFENCPTLNMLNTKYIIYHPEQPPLVNSYADGNAWFVNSYRFVNTPDEEIGALETLHPKTEAVLDKEFESNLAGLKIVPDSTASIEMTAYYPNKVEYQSSSSQAGLAVFSEVYYKNGWKAFIDGERIAISRADWILRAIPIPAGKHHIEFVFDPDDVRVCGTITTIFSGLLVLLLLIAIVKTIFVNFSFSKK